MDRARNVIDEETVARLVEEAETASVASMGSLDKEFVIHWLAGVAAEAMSGVSAGFVRAVPAEGVTEKPEAEEWDEGEAL